MIPNALSLASLKRKKKDKSVALFSESDRDRKKNPKKCAMCNDIIPTEKKTQRKREWWRRMDGGRMKRGWKLKYVWLSWPSFEKIYWILAFTSIYRKACRHDGNADNLKKVELYSNYTLQQLLVCSRVFRCFMFHVSYQRQIDRLNFRHRDPLELLTFEPKPF